MLSRHTARQPYQRYSVFGLKATEHGETLCSHCSYNVFTRASLEKIRLCNAIGAAIEEIAYSRSCKAIHTSMGEGCEWCTSIGSSVLTAVHLDFWYHSANTPTSSNCGSVSSAEAHVDNVTGPDTDTTKDESTDWEDAAGSSDEIEPQQASSLTASALDCDTMLRVNMKFRTTASVLSTIKRLDVRIECCETVFEGGPFADLRNEQAVEVSFEVYQGEKYSYSRRTVTTVLTSLQMASQPIYRSRNLAWKTPWLRPRSGWRTAQHIRAARSTSVLSYQPG